MQSIVECILKEAYVLQKLTLCKVNLNDFKIINMLCEIIKSKEFLIYLDLSWAKLAPRHMVRIAAELKENYKLMRSLNLSYNSLAPEPFSKRDAEEKTENAEQ